MSNDYCITQMLNTFYENGMVDEKYNIRYKTNISFADFKLHLWLIILYNKTLNSRLILDRSLISDAIEEFVTDLRPMTIL